MKKKWISGGVIALYLVCLIGCEKYGQPHQEELESQSDAESYSVVSEMSNEDSDIENSEGEYGMLTIEDVRRLAEKHDTLTLQDLEPYMDDTFGIQNNKMTELPFIYEGKEYYLRVVSDFGELNAIVVFDKEFLELKTMEDEYAYQGGCADIRAGVLEHILSGTVTMEDYMTFELPGELVQSRFCHWMGTRGGIIFLTGEDEQKLKLENTGLYAVVDQNHPLRGGIEIKGRGETEALATLKEWDDLTVGDVTIKRKLMQNNAEGYMWYVAYTEKEASRIEYCLYLNQALYSEEEFIRMSETIQFQEHSFY